MVASGHELGVLYEVTQEAAQFLLEEYARPGPLGTDRVALLAEALDLGPPGSCPTSTASTT